MKNILIFIVFLGLFCPKIFGQEHNGVLKGKVTFITSQNVYVKFENTENIQIGDTLKIASNNSPCLIVNNKSSNSCVAVLINGCNVKKDDEILFTYLIVSEPVIKIKNNLNTTIDSTAIKTSKSVTQNQEDVKDLERISGNFSVATYSNHYNIRDDRHRLMSRFSIYADHIKNSKFSFETYLNYNKEIFSGTNGGTLNQHPFKVYDLALKYDATPTLSIALGRKINNNMSSVGAIDGLQVEKYFGKNYVGIISGFRPDIYNYGFNSNLFQYGAYIGRSVNNENLSAQTTLGIIEQQNSGQIDRRYTYFQHSSTLFNALNLFSSFELDIYNNITSDKFRLTNLYLSARYRFSSKFNLGLSYDSRKNVIYYETFQTEIERLLADDIARQGLRFNVNIRPIKYVNAGFSYSQRFQSDNLNKSDNMNGFLSFSKIPALGGSLSINYNKNASNYLESSIISFRHSRTFFKDKLFADFYYRVVDYNYLNNNITASKQNYYGADLSLNIGKKLMLSLSGEYLTSDLENNYRINTRIVKRFNNQKKKNKL